MQYAKKMLLISPDTLQQKMSMYLNKEKEVSSDNYAPRKGDPIKNLEKEMYSILKTKNTEDRDKWSTYYQLMQRYFRHMDEKRKPLLQENGNDHIEEEKMPSEQIIEIMPANMQRKARILLNWIDRSKVVRWNGMGEVSLDGKKMSGSNIIDMIRDLMTDRKIPPPLGMKEFGLVLKNLNVPDSLMANHTKWTNFTSGSR